MDGNGTENGIEGSKRRVKFGDGPSQSVPHEWAETMLRHLFARHQRAFSDALMEAVGLHIPRPGRKVDA